jgi:DNA-binding XRE family transcriptional regulator
MRDERTFLTEHTCRCTLVHMTLAELIKQARAEAGLSQSQLASAIGATKRSIAYWESKEDRHPDWTFMVRIARATSKPLDFFATAIH